MSRNKPTGNSDTDTRRLARADLYSKLVEAEMQLESGEPLLDAGVVFGGLKKKHTGMTKERSEDVSEGSDQEIDEAAKGILSKHRRAFEELSK